MGLTEFNRILLVFFYRVLGSNTGVGRGERPAGVGVAGAAGAARGAAGVGRGRRGRGPRPVAGPFAHRHSGAWRLVVAILHLFFLFFFLLMFPLVFSFVSDEFRSGRPFHGVRVPRPHLGPPPCRPKRR